MTGREGTTAFLLQDLASVSFNGSNAEQYVQLSHLHVLRDTASSQDNTFPRPPLQRKPIPLTELRTFLNSYQHDPNHPTDLQLKQPQSELALQLLLREKPSSAASSMYLNALNSKYTAKAFNVTDDAKLAAKAQGILVSEASKEPSAADPSVMVSHYALQT